MTALTSRSLSSPFARLSLTRPTRAHADIAAAYLCMAILVVTAAMPDARDSEAAARAATSVATGTIALPGTETTLGFYLGAPYHYPSDFHLQKAGHTDLTIKDVEWYTHPFEHPLYYGARIQRWLGGGRFGTMIDFTHSKAYAPMDQFSDMEGTVEGKPVKDLSIPEKPGMLSPRQLFDKLEWTHGHNMLTLNGLMRFANFGRISPYAGVGAGISLPHSEIHLLSDPARTYEYQYTGPVAQALVGVEFRLKTGSVFVEYKFTSANYWGPLTFRDGTWFPMDMWRQLSRWWSGEEPPGGWAGAKLTSHQVISGFLVRSVPANATIAK